MRKNSAAFDKESRREVTADVHVCVREEDVQNSQSRAVWERRLGVNPRVYLQVKEGSVLLRVTVCRISTSTIFSNFFLSQLCSPPPASLRHCRTVAAERRQRTSTGVFSVCFSRLSDPCGLSLDTNDSPLSLMPAVLAHGAQEKEPDRWWPLASSLTASEVK